MTKQQICGLKWLSLIGGALLSIVVPALLIGLDVNSELAIMIFVPGVMLMSPVHNVLPALVVWVVFDAIVYCAVTYSAVALVVKILQNRQLSSLSPSTEND